jgi:muramoyltetrapeptide carboxypeptidase
VGGFAGCILLLEDVNEDCYRLDRMLTQLLRSGALGGVAGIALGSWTGCTPPDGVRGVMADRLAGLGVPVAWGFGFGHVAPQPTIPLGVPARLDASTGTLTFLEPAVS